MKSAYEKHSALEIAKMLKLSERTVFLWLRHFGIEIRERSDAMTFKSKKPSKEELERLYCQKGKTKKDLLRHYGVGEKLLKRWFMDYGIDFRKNTQMRLAELSQEELLTHGRRHYQGITKTELAQRHSAEYAYLQSSGLIDLMVEEGIIVWKRNKNGFWTRDKVLEVATRLFKEHGCMPRQQEYARLGYGSFPAAAVEHFGGLSQLRTLLESGNLAKSKLEGFLEGYAAQDTKPGSRKRGL